MMETFPLAVLQNLKFISMVCEPVKRAYSDYSHALRIREWDNRLKKANLSFERVFSDGIEALAKKEINFYETERPELSIVSNGCFGRRLEPWRTVFGKQLLVVDGEQ